MTVNKCVEIIDNLIQDFMTQNGITDCSTYKIPATAPSNPTSQDKVCPLWVIANTGNRKLDMIELALMETAIKTVPNKLLRTNDSLDSQLKRVSSSQFVAVPMTPVAGKELDIDDGLGFAVAYTAYYYIASDYDQKASVYKQLADGITLAFDTAYKELQTTILTTGQQVAPAQELYFRYSSNGSDWHESFTGGDIYISIRNTATGAWSSPIRFVGRDMSDGRFTELLDTPKSYSGKAGKIIAVNSTENGLEFITAPSGGGTATPLTGQAKFGDYRQEFMTVSGNISLDTQNYNVFNVIADGSNAVTIGFVNFDNGNGNKIAGYSGTEYSILINPLGSAVSFDTKNNHFYGDVTIPSNSGTIIDLIYDGSNWIVKNKQNIAGY